MAPALSYTGRILACEEYALRGEDFCKWARQPNRGVDARRSLALESRFPLTHGSGAHLGGGGGDWRPWHLLLILLVVGCVALMARDELRRTSGGWHHRDEEDEEDEERDNDYENERRRGAAAAFSGRMSFKRTLRRKVDVVEREGLPWKCS
ncbi:hypothetical protein LQW54_002449 [Pestalotiopsis sp. IQ-011]